MEEFVLHIKTPCGGTNLAESVRLLVELVHINNCEFRYDMMIL